MNAKIAIPAAGVLLAGCVASGEFQNGNEAPVKLKASYGVTSFHQRQVDDSGKESVIDTIYVGNGAGKTEDFVGYPKLQDRSEKLDRTIRQNKAAADFSAFAEAQKYLDGVRAELAKAQADVASYKAKADKAEPELKAKEARVADLEKEVERYQGAIKSYRKAIGLPDAAPEQKK
jgi:hypothetical protein